MAKIGEIREILKELKSDEEAANLGLKGVELKNYTKNKVIEYIKALGREIDESLDVDQVIEFYYKISLFDKVETEEEESPAIANDYVEPCNYSNSEDIMGLFLPEELEDGAPKVNGLRRVANVVIGNVVNQDVDIKPVTININDRIVSGVSAVFKITFCCNNTNFGRIGEYISFSDAADCIPAYNSTDMYGRFVTAMAATRAEARVYRKALRLNVVAAEEKDDEVKAIVESENAVVDNSITIAQTKALQIACKNKGLDLEKDILAVSSRNISSIEELTSDDFRKIMKYIGEKKNG